MSKQSTMKTLDNLSETPITQADIDSGKLKLIKRRIRHHSSRRQRRTPGDHRSGVTVLVARDRRCQ